LSQRYDIAIVGSGFAGSLLAMIARRLGRSVVMIEKGTHPRVVIGESSTPLSNLLLEDLATQYDLPAIAPLTKWGSWQRTYPGLACGLKRGFTFHHHVLGKPHAPCADRQDQLLVAASPHDGIADTHWYRADFDHFLVREAQKLGVQYFDEVTLRRCADRGDFVRLEGERHGQSVSFDAQFVIDATGPRGFLHHALQLGERELPNLPATQALFNHFTGVKRLGDGSASRTEEAPPYPIDDAAVHHAFDGGWVWVLQFNNGVTSAGVAATDDVAAKLNFKEGANAWQRLLEMIPALREQFAEAETAKPYTHISRLSFRSAAVSGDRWAMLPSAAGFVDPLLSIGFPLTLLGISRMAKIIERDWNSESFESTFKRYAYQTDAELVAASRLIGALYRNMNDFPVFVSLTLLYFAAVSFSEATRRLGKPELAPSFLLHDDPVFGPACLDILERAQRSRTESESSQLSNDILSAIEPFNVACLGDASRKNWYPVNAADLIASSHKLNASYDEVLQLLQRSGFAISDLHEPTSLAPVYSQ
jgi:tetracycline 7-halogenase / FADH2 O2-dependent halogenase